MQKATEVAPLQPLQPISLQLGLSKYQRNSPIVSCHLDPNHTICEDLRSFSISLLNQPPQKKTLHQKKTGATYQLCLFVALECIQHINIITTPLMGGGRQNVPVHFNVCKPSRFQNWKKNQKGRPKSKITHFFKGQTSKCNITFWRLYPCFLQQGVKMYYYIFTLGPCWRRKKVILHFDVVLNLRRIEGAKKGKNVKKIVFRRKNWQNPQKWQTRAESYKK